MTSELTGILSVCIGMAELPVYSLAALGLFRHWGYTLAEAAACAALLPAMLMSFLLQIVFVSGFPELIGYVRVAFLAVAAAFLWRHRRAVYGVGRALVLFARDHPVAVAGLFGALGTLALAAVVSGWNARPIEYPGLVMGFWHLEETLAPLNVIILMRAVASSSGFLGMGLLAWMAFVSICFATYALSRRYAWPPTAITVTLLVASMPRLVFLSVSSGIEIVPAAATLLFVLVLYRTVERPDIKDLLLLLLALTFSISGDRMCLLFPSIGLGLTAIVLYRRHGGRIWWDMVRQTPVAVAAAGVPLLIYSQAWLFVRNGIAGQHWAGGGPQAQWVYNTDGLSGWAGNLLRYGLQIFDFTPPVEQIVEKLFGFNWQGARLWIHDHLLAAVFNPDGLAASFTLPGSPDRSLAWFGPFAGLLVLPAVGWALLRGPRRLKSLALALSGYFALVALIPAWMPGNVRYLTIFFVCAGFTTAFLLPPWRMTSRRRRFLQVSAIALMIYAVGDVCRTVFANAWPG